jgi:hypothetical protein
MSALPVAVTLDGELVAFGPDGSPDFPFPVRANADAPAKDRNQGDHRGRSNSRDARHGADTKPGPGTSTPRGLIHYRTAGVDGFPKRSKLASPRSESEQPKLTFLRRAA